jgi:glycosyltransferase involved in cell wall biosynthesis
MTALQPSPNLPPVPESRRRAAGLTLADLTPSDGVAADGPGWRVDAPHVRFAAPAELAAGWYEVRVAAASGERFAVRKRLELTFDAVEAAGRPPAREAFAWNRGFADRFVLKLTRPAAGVRLDVRHAEGPLTLPEFAVTPLGRAEVVARAVREKVRLTLAYRCFGGALRRGAKLLAAGKVREFATKLMKGLTDGRGMQLGRVAVGEADGSWWRRHALPAEQAEAVRAAVDALSGPPPLAVILPVDGNRLDPARISAHSVRRQLYPHWHLVIVAADKADIESHLRLLLPHDDRVTVVRVPKAAGLAGAVFAAATASPCERTLVLPPGLELAEDALYQFARAAMDAPETGTLAAPVAVGLAAASRGGAVATPRVHLTRTARLLTGERPLPADDTPEELGRWSGDPAAKELDAVLAYPVDDRPLIDRARLGTAPAVRGKTLWLGGDVRGIGGYDHVVFAFLHGLPSLGADLRLHPTSTVRGDLVPPSMMPPVAGRPTGQPMLVAGPPFLVPRFGLDRQTAAYTMWETDRLDPHWTPLLNNAGLVIVPSAWQRDCFRADGVTAPIEIAPLGIDPLVYHAAGKPPEVCTFGTAGALGSGGLRKNAQWVIDLFRRAFPTQTDVRLRVKITPGSPGVETYDDPRVDVIRALLPHAEMADWYRSLTAYVNGSMGEGFGLHLAEAMACGRPLVTANYSGLTAFFDPSVGYEVGYKLVEARNEIYRGRWAQPDEDAVVARMREIHADPAEAARLGERCASRAKLITWKAAGKQLAAALRKHGFLGEGRS